MTDGNPVLVDLTGHPMQEPSSSPEAGPVPEVNWRGQHAVRRAPGHEERDAPQVPDAIRDFIWNEFVCDEAFIYGLCLERVLVVVDEQVRGCLAGIDLAGDVAAVSMANAAASIPASVEVYRNVRSRLESNVPDEDGKSPKQRLLEVIQKALGDQKDVEEKQKAIVIPTSHGFWRSVLETITSAFDRKKTTRNSP